MEKMVHRRLTWLLDCLDVLPAEMSGFRRQRCTADAIMDLSSSLEEARAHNHTAHIAFVDIYHAFDALPHATVLNSLRRSGVLGRPLQYIQNFLSNRRLHVKLHGFTSSARLVTQGVPQGSVLSPLLFNVALAELPQYLPQPGLLELHVAIYADDIVLWCSGPTSVGRTVRDTLQCGLDATSGYFSAVGLAISPSKTSSIAYLSDFKIRPYLFG